MPLKAEYRHLATRSYNRRTAATVLGETDVGLSAVGAFTKTIRFT